MKLFGKRPKPVFYPWIGEIHDARFTLRDLSYSKERRAASLTFWRCVAGDWQRWSGKKNEDIPWEAITVSARNVDAFELLVSVTLPTYELSSVYHLPEESRVVFEIQHGMNLSLTGASLKIDLCSTPSSPKSWHDAFEKTA